MAEQVRSWQIKLGIIGSIVWMITLSNTENIRELGIEELSLASIGYIMGFIIAFSGYVWWEIVRNNAYKFLDTNPFWRPLSVVVIGVVLLSGLSGLLIQIFKTLSWIYNSGALAGSIVVGIGLIPTMNEMDRT